MDEEAEKAEKAKAEKAEEAFYRYAANEVVGIASGDEELTEFIFSTDWEDPYSIWSKPELLQRLFEFRGSLGLHFPTLMPLVQALLSPNPHKRRRIR